MMKQLGWMAVAAWLGAGAVAAQERAPLNGTQPLNDQHFQERIRGLKNERSGTEKLRLARRALAGNLLSSLQVKTIASHLSDDSARLEFASAAFPRTVDPENFYEVYDAFSSFSKVMRLHDQIRQLQPPRPVPVEVVVQPVTDAEMKDILQAIRKESFDNTKSQIARQILRGSRGNFLSRQIKEIVGCFDFEPTKLELAKFAYDYTLDREKYYLVNDAFTFATSKENLSRYLDSRPQPPPPRRP
jgi:hypothetical protein